MNGLTEELKDSYRTRLAQVHPVYEPVFVEPNTVHTRQVHIHPSVLAIIESTVFEENSYAAYWAQRVQHRIHLYPAVEASTEQIRHTLEEAVVQACAQDEQMRQQQDSGSGSIPDGDRAIMLDTPYRDRDITAAACQAGFHLGSMRAYQRVEVLAEHIQQRIEAQPVGGAPQLQISAPDEGDEEVIIEALEALKAYDDFLLPRPLRPNRKQIVTSYARAAVAAGQGWTVLGRMPGQPEIALLTFDTPEKAAWARTGLALDHFSYLGFAFTPAGWRAHGVMNQLMAAGLEFLAQENIEHIGVGYCQNNPLSSRYWLRCGFIPAIAEWNMGMSQARGVLAARAV